MRNSASGINIAYKTSPVVIVGTSRVLVQNNVFEQVGKDPVGGDLINGRLLQVLGPVTDLTFLNNTTTLAGDVGQLVGFDGGAAVRMTVVNNVFPTSTYGFKGSGTGAGNAPIAAWMPGGLVAGNVLPGQDAGAYPNTNFFPQNSAAILFQALLSGDFSLSASNPFYSGIYGRIGVDNSVLSRAIDGVREGS